MIVERSGMPASIDRLGKCEAARGPGLKRDCQRHGRGKKRCSVVSALFLQELRRVGLRSAQRDRHLRNAVTIPQARESTELDSIRHFGVFPE